mmetsp:Transcript_12291/g.19057  ORF Transcript_12291/g.19057 Transcript_12291/m.19057 type:complete len:103 (-) Transcript_12291:1987-2295(-)
MYLSSIWPDILVATTGAVSFGTEGRLRIEEAGLAALLVSKTADKLTKGAFVYKIVWATLASWKLTLLHLYLSEFLGASSGSFLPLDRSLEPLLERRPSECCA